MTSHTLDRFRPRPSRDRVVYTVQEVADLLGLALSGTYLLIREGTIPAIKMGGRWLVPKTRFHAWLDGIEARTRTTSPTAPDVRQPATATEGGGADGLGSARRRPAHIARCGAIRPAGSGRRRSRPSGRRTRSWPRWSLRSTGGPTSDPTPARCASETFAATVARQSGGRGTDGGADAVGPADPRPPTVGGLAAGEDRPHGRAGVGHASSSGDEREAPWSAVTARCR